MRIFIITFLSFIFLSAIAFAWLNHSGSEKDLFAFYKPPSRKESKPPAKEFSKLQTKADAARIYAKQKGFNSSVAFLIDMNLPANNKRFFIYRLDRDTIQNSGLVTHGNCNQYWLKGRRYSNSVGCGCTSLGKYKIGNAYYGRFGLAFKLHGLDNTNNNAFKRYVVLHAHDCVPDKEVVEEICQSNGCPTVSPQFLKVLESIVKGSEKPVLLWIYE